MSGATRRDLLIGATALAGALGLPGAARAQLPADSQALEAAIRNATGGAKVREGKVKLDVPPLSENGNSVSLTVAVESPMTPSDHVRAIHIFAEKNPQPNVISARLGPRAGVPTLQTRIRLADTQDVIAIAELSDGTFWQATGNVIITLSACLEDPV